jgi:hypothetical protein
MDWGYGMLWGIWGLLFLAIEGAALSNKDNGDTLSEFIWKWIGKKGYEKPKGYKYRRGALGVFLLWLIAHFFEVV